MLEALLPLVRHCETSFVSIVFVYIGVMSAHNLDASTFEWQGDSIS